MGAILHCLESATDWERRHLGGDGRPAPRRGHLGEGDQTGLVGNPKIPSREVKPWLSLKNPLILGRSTPP